MGDGVGCGCVCSVWLLILPTVWLGPAESAVRVCSRVDEAGLFVCVNAV